MAFVKGDAYQEKHSRCKRVIKLDVRFELLGKTYWSAEVVRTIDGVRPAARKWTRLTERTLHSNYAKVS